MDISLIISFFLNMKFPLNYYQPTLKAMVSRNNARVQALVILFTKIGDHLLNTYIFTFASLFFILNKLIQVSGKFVVSFVSR